MNYIIGIFFYSFSLLLPWHVEAAQSDSAVPQAGDETLQYKVSYQGLLSVFLPVEIARATLHLHGAPEIVDGEQMRHASLAVSTEPYPRMEAFYPLRFDYHSWFEPGLRYSGVVDIRKRTSKSRHDLLWFNREEGVVRNYQKKKTKESGVPELPGFLHQVSRLQQPGSFRERHVQKLGSSDVLDRLAMLYALRKRSLTPGEVIELVVSNGKDLLGYLVTVEAQEQLVVNGEPVSTLRLKLTPHFKAGGDRGYAVRVWMSDDERRLPVRFRSSKLGGSIELDLDPAALQAG